MTRKEFLKTFFIGMVGGTATILGLKCSSPESPDQPNGDEENEQTFTSNTVDGHTHTVTLEKSEIENPPDGGISKNTSYSGGHTHTFSMTQQQLMDVKNGQTVTVSDSVVSNHQHDYDISKWY